MIIIAAMTGRRVIGKDNAMPWHIKEDMQLFKRFTTDNTVIMGRKTYDSLKRPLKNRNNIVISSSMAESEGLTVCRTLEEALDVAERYRKENFIIGGARVYEQALPLADEMYLSFVRKDYEGDVFFPAFDEKEWKTREIREYDEFVWKSYVRI